MKITVFRDVTPIRLVDKKSKEMFNNDKLGSFERELIFSIFYYLRALSFRGHAVAQLVEALLYKPEGHGFDSRWCHWNFSLT
jgi:hypothetical protein